MYQDFKISPPFFEFGPKAYLYGEDLLRLAKYADQASIKYNVQLIITPQNVDIPLLKRETNQIYIFAQHMDPLEIGRGLGSVLPEALKAAGADGVLLNHAERPLTLEIIEKTIGRADDVGLASMVCAGNISEIQDITKMNPNILLAEAPELIGTGKRSPEDMEVIQRINDLVWSINPAIRILHGAGISCGQDVYDVIAAGAQATGSTSGIIKANSPAGMMDEMLRNVREAWDQIHPSE
ncbi:MAG: triose-phosphate isomerase [Anaerolineales bacterium]|nr:triose-phosphate isomerase [Anaerolineales bacterium]